MDTGRLLAELREAELILATKLPRRNLSAIEIFGQALRQRNPAVFQASGNGMELQHLVIKAWNELPPDQRGQFEQAGVQDEMRYHQETRDYEGWQRHARALHSQLAAYGISSGGLAHQGSAYHHTDPDLALTQSPSVFNGQVIPLEHPQRVYGEQEAINGGDERWLGTNDPSEGGTQPRSVKRPAGHIERGDSGSDPIPSLPDDRQATVAIFCGEKLGTMLISDQKVICECPSCKHLPESDRTMSCTQFEVHAGCASAKKWKTSLKVRPGAEPEVRPGGSGMPIGRWLDLRGYDTGVNRNRGPGSNAGVSNTAAGLAVERPVRQRRESLVLSDSVVGLVEGVGTPSTTTTSQGHQNVKNEPTSSLSPAAAAQAAVAAWTSGFKRPPGRPPKDGIYKPERLAAAAAAVAAAAAQHGSTAALPPSSLAISNVDRQFGGVSIPGIVAVGGAGASTQVVTTASQPWMDIPMGRYAPVRARWAGERCCVCDLDTDTEFDQLVSCDACGITVHQSCYGIPEPPDQDELWLCEACEASRHEAGEEEVVATRQQCCLCPVTGGALRRAAVAPGNLWAHVVCMQWISETSVGDAITMSPILGIETIQRERWELTCSVCRQKAGAKIQCHTCYTAYHPLCARIAGLRMDVVESADGGVAMLSYCPKHAPPAPQLAGVKRVDEDEERGDLPDFIQNPPKLWDASPFPLAPRCPLPEATAGAARAEGILSWHRQSHGTGTGVSSTAGFWIPEPPPLPPAPRKNTDGYSSLIDGPDALPDEFHAPRRGRPGSSSGGRSGRSSRWRAGSRNNAEVTFNLPGQEPSEPEPVELVPLPSGLEGQEEIAFRCGNHHAILHVRSQHVIHRGEYLAPSKFESMCGKPDAKKWKVSFWRTDADGEPIETLHDWLSRLKLDRKALDALARNWLAYDAYDRHTRRTVKQVVGEVLLAAGAEPLGSEARSESEERVAATLPTPSVSEWSQTTGSVGGVAGTSIIGAGGDDVLLTNSSTAAAMEATSPEARPLREPASTVDKSSGLQHHLGVDKDVLLADKEEEEEEEVRAKSSPVGAGGEEDERVLGVAGLTDEATSLTKYGDSATPNGPDMKEQGPTDIPVRAIRSAVFPAEPSSSTVSVKGNARKPSTSHAAAAAPHRRPLRVPVGSFVRLYWPDDAEWYVGEVVGVEGAQHRIKYRLDGEEELLNLAEESANGRLQMLPGSDEDQWPPVPEAGPVDGSNNKKGGQGVAPITTNGSGEQPDPANAPDSVPVVCRGLQGVFHPRQLVIRLMPGGEEVSPTEFERLAGRGAAKKWKSTIRIDPAGDGTPGLTVQDWLIKHGLEAAKTPRPSKGMQETLLRRHAAASRNVVGSSGPSLGSKTGHRPGCACVVCKQSRRSGTSSLRAAGGAGAGARHAEESDPGRPPWRARKQAYLRPLPHLVSCAGLPHALHEVPVSRCWTPEDWAAHRVRQATWDKRRGIKDTTTGVRFVPGSAAAVLSGGFGGAIVEAPPLPRSLGCYPEPSHPLSIKERLETCDRTEGARLAFGKSGIHGWGMFAKVPIRQDSMVIEYRGDLVRRPLADLREARYRASGKDCYLFNVDDALVIDATLCGNWARFINHSCNPSTYTKILNVDGLPRLVFFARFDIQIGQELSYNYRFKREEGEARLPCFCGAPNCSGYLN